MAAMLLHSSLFVLAYAATFYNCTMPPREGECSICKNCVYVTNNFGCKKFGEKRHAATKSVKKCLSKDASCGGEQERCFGALYECEPGYERPDGSSDHAVTCNNGRLDYGPACVKKISCTAEETTTATLSGASDIAGGASATYECKSGWENAAGSPQVSSFVATCVRNESTPDSGRGVLSPSPAAQCAIRPGCTNATQSNFDYEATVDDGSCMECFADSHCSGVAGKPRCDTAQGVCVSSTSLMMLSGDATSLATLALLVGLLLCCCIALYCFRSKRSKSAEDRENRVHMKDAPKNSSHSSRGVRKSHRSARSQGSHADSRRGRAE